MRYETKEGRAELLLVSHSLGGLTREERGRHTKDGTRFPLLVYDAKESMSGGRAIGTMVPASDVENRGTR